jgi:DNA-binding CsgD family transcriptional regulator
MKPETLLLLLDPDRVVDGDRGSLAMLLGLTPAETGLAMLLGQGLSLGDAAAALGVRMPTVRAQLRAIFAKTGVTRQSELVRVILNYAAAGAVPGTATGGSSTMSRP